MNTLYSKVKKWTPLSPSVVLIIRRYASLNEQPKKTKRKLKKETENNKTF